MKVIWEHPVYPIVLREAPSIIFHGTSGLSMHFEFFDINNNDVTITTRINFIRTQSLHVDGEMVLVDGWNPACNAGLVELERPAVHENAINRRLKTKGLDSYKSIAQSTKCYQIFAEDLGVVTVLATDVVIESD